MLNIFQRGIFAVACAALISLSACASKKTTTTSSTTTAPDTMVNTDANMNASYDDRTNTQYERRNETIRTTNSSADAVPATTETHMPAATEPNNSIKNKRDHHAESATADHQAHGTKADTELTRKIRRAITKDKSLSTSAHNIKIVTKDGKVELRGPVNSDEERTKVGSIATEIAGSEIPVENSVEVKTK